MPRSTTWTRLRHTLANRARGEEDLSAQDKDHGAGEGEVDAMGE